MKRHEYDVSILNHDAVRLFAYVIIAGSIWLLQGCGLTGELRQNIYEDYSVGKLDTDSDLGSDAKDNVKKCVRDASVSSGISESETKECVLLRNSLMTKWVAASDKQCEAHMKTIYGNEAASNIVFGTLTNIFTGLGTIFSDPATKTALSASALFSNSQRSLVNETVYKSVVISSIVKKIRDDREKRRAAILANLKDTTLSYERYPINAAAADIADYHYHCSFMYGLQKALEEGTQDTASRRILELKRNLNELELKIKNREVELRSQGKMAEEIRADYFLPLWKAQYEAMRKALTALEAPASAAVSDGAISAGRGATLEDAAVPTIESFELPPVSSPWKVTFTKFAAADDVGVTGYMITESRDFSDFYEEEFGDEKKSVRQLCKSIGGAKYDLGSIGPKANTVAWLNKILEIPNLYAKVQNIEPILSLTNKRIGALVDETKRYREREFDKLTIKERTKIKRLNRLLIEMLHPKETPKSIEGSPKPSNPNWEDKLPLSYEMKDTSEGKKALYAWVKDGAGNIASKQNEVDILFCASE